MLSSGSPVGLIGGIGIGSGVGGTMQPQTTTSTGGVFSAYSERPQMGLDVEFGADPASGAFFQADGRKHDDLKQMLDSNKDGLKLEAMKRIIGMVARGRDASDLFPAVVKNVVSKNIEVKKLVYVYLVRYAEEQQDLALLSISTFQRALKDPNQLIRASALRVLSSIRVSMIVPIVLLAIRDSAADMSPYVRKTAAHAIPKLYSLDPEQKDELVTVIEKLLSDRTTLVVGSAVMAFDEVCPERVDLIHKNYRKLCHLLVDVDEWGQVIIINMLTRYARTQFVDPNADEPNGDEQGGGGDGDGSKSTNQKFYDGTSDSTSASSSSSSSESDDNSHQRVKRNKSKKTRSNVGEHQSSITAPSSPYHVDLDHRLLLRQAKPLLQSRNASVVMAVAQLYHHVAPRTEVPLIAKALIRLLRSHKEVQSVVLTCIASISVKRKYIFEPHIKSFFVRTSDPTHIKLLKLDILTNLASASSISLILREFQTYISSSDRSFVAATIQAIGRCAASIKEVTETCLSGLVHLLSNHDEHVVAESVIVIKKLLQTKAAEHFEIITQMAKLLDFIMVPAARASIIWLIGEYNEKVPKIAPDVLRKMAKSFVDEEDAVKLQVLNLSVKLYLTNSQQTSLLCQYVFTLARYDPNYDIRDRARFLRQFIFPASGNSTILSQNAYKIFLSPKPAPALESKHQERSQYQMGSLSHYLNMRANGYKDLPPFPTQAPDPWVRNIDGAPQESAGDAGVATNNVKTPQKHTNSNSHPKADAKVDKSFFSESDQSSGYSNSDSNSGSSDSESAVSGSSSSSAVVDGVKSADTKKITKTKPTTAPAPQPDSSEPKHVDLNETKSPSGHESSSSASADSETSSSESVSDSSDTESEASKPKENNSSSNIANRAEHSENMSVEKVEKKSKSDLDLLLDLSDDVHPIGPVMTPSLGGFLTPVTPQAALNRIEPVGAAYIEHKHKQLLDTFHGHGMQVNYRYTREPSYYSPTMVSIELIFDNKTSEPITNIHVSKQALQSGMSLKDFGHLDYLGAQWTTTATIGIDFNDSTRPVQFDISSSAGTSQVTLKPPIGELIRAVEVSDAHFKEQRTKLRGMNEHQKSLSFRADSVDMAKLRKKLFEIINVASIVHSDNPEEIFHWAGQTISSSCLVLITLDGCASAEENSQLTLTVNCEKMLIGSMVCNELQSELEVAFNMGLLTL